jgi:hypothetical protein
MSTEQEARSPARAAHLTLEAKVENPSRAVDAVPGDQVARLKMPVETGAPSTRS